VLGRVSGAPLALVVERINEVSDNEAAEVVARHVGLEVARDSSFRGAVRGMRGTLDGLGLDVRGSRWYDGSGLSRHNRLTPDLLLGVLRVASSPERPDLRATVTGLPVAGFNGSLQYRFAEDFPDGLGRVRAKTGTLVEGGVHGLAGLVTDRRGTPLVFAITADRVRYEDALDAREAVDRLAAALAACACSRPAA
jgi:D-alanyl-D-alanine carboxypeptidase/D-alanyl-D-alanine-endopeptidase (penicillin-binding protein 4)